MKEISEIIRWAAGLTGLGVLSIVDIRKRELTVWPLVAVGLVGIVLSLLGRLWQGPEALCQFLPGIVCLLFARISRESIGYGDGIVILCMGGYLSLAQLLGMCMAALFLAGLAALFLLFVLRKGRKERVPFVPFLLAGYIIILVGEHV